MVRAAVVGPEGAGKTSLLAAAATETFPLEPPPALPGFTRCVRPTGRPVANGTTPCSPNPPLSRPLLPPGP